MIRVRIAPSPTGHLHLGNARTAVFNWLYAKNNSGAFIVRIDDTDTERSTKEFEEDILSSLTWLGLDWDEGVRAGGAHGSYRQSERFERYRSIAEELVDKNLAYEEDGAIKFRVEKSGSINFSDMVRGAMVFNKEDIEDFVILRSDGSPTYHLASTIDDIDYEITHVSRGEDILPSTPKHILITEALGGDIPIYCHLPLLFGHDGKRLSKRHGATSVSEYRNKGYLEDALFNYLCLLGWSPGDDIEVFDKDFAASKFDFNDVLASSAIFDETKLSWMNGVYIREMSMEAFNNICLEEISKNLEREIFESEKESLKILLPTLQERVENRNDIFEQVNFVLDEPFEINRLDWESVSTEDAKKYLKEVKESLKEFDEILDIDKLELLMRGLLKEHNLKAKEGFQAVRVAITGSKISPPLFESMVALGKAGCLARIEERI